MCYNQAWPLQGKPSRVSLNVEHAYYSIPLGYSICGSAYIVCIAPKLTE